MHDIPCSGELVSDKINALGLTNTEAATLIGISDSFLRDIRRGYSFPSIKSVMLIASALGLDVRAYIETLIAERVSYYRDLLCDKYELRKEEPHE